MPSPAYSSILPCLAPVPASPFSPPARPSVSQTVEGHLGHVTLLRFLVISLGLATVDGSGSLEGGEGIRQFLLNQAHV